MNMLNIWPFLLLFLQYTTALSYEEALRIASKKDGLLYVNGKSYEKLIKNENYSFVIFLTAEDARVGCTLCHDFGPKYKAIAKQYFENLNDPQIGMYNPIDSDNDKSRVIFGFSDYMSAQTYFEKLGMTSVPKLLYYEPGKAPQLADFTNEFSFLTVENTDSYTRWLAQNIPGLDPKFLEVQIPVSKSKLYTSIAIGIASLALLFKFRSSIFKVVQQKTVWEVFSLSLIILFISGYMFNQIRNSETSRKDKEGNVVYFAKGFNMQFGAETQIISIVYTILSGCLFSLIKILPNLKKSTTKLVASVTVCFIMFIVYSYLVEVYHLKSSTYPFHLWNAFKSS